MQRRRPVLVHRRRLEVHEADIPLEDSYQTVELIHAPAAEQPSPPATGIKLHLLPWRRTMRLTEPNKETNRHAPARQAHQPLNRQAHHRQADYPSPRQHNLIPTPRLQLHVMPRNRALRTRHTPSATNRHPHTDRAAPTRHLSTIGKPVSDRATDFVVEQ